MRYALLSSLLVLGLFGCNENTDFRPIIEKMPQTYRDCAAEIIPELNGTGRVTQQDLIRYTARLKKVAHRKDACLHGAIEWADAQYQAYRRKGY